MKQLKVLFLTALLFSLIGINSCTIPEFGSVDEGDWNPDFVIPVVNTSISLEDLLDNFETGGFVTTDPDNVVVVVYENQFRYSFSSDFEKIPTLPLFVNGNTQNAPFPSPLRYDEIRIDSAKANFTVNNPSSSQDVNVTLTIQDLTQMGVPLQTSFTIPAGSNFSDEIPLIDYLLSFPNGSYTTQYTAVEANSGTSVTLQPFLFFINNIDYSLVQGYLGTDTIQMATGNIVFDFLQNWSQGSVVFEEPKITFSFDNAYGAPVRIYTDSVRFQTNLNGTVDLNNSNFTNGFDLAYPTINEIGQKKFSSFDVDQGNSNIVPVIGGVPYEMGYTINGVFNADKDSTIINFLTDSAHIDIGVDIELPMHLSAKGFGIKQSFDIDFSGIDVVERIGFKFIAENGFPLEVGMQIKFLDAGGQAIDSLWLGGSELIIESAPVDGQGFVTAPQVKETIVEIDATRFEVIKDLAKKIELEATLETLNQGNTPVKILDTYRITTKLGVTAGL